MSTPVKPLIDLGPKLDEQLRRRPMTPEQIETARLLAAVGVTGLHKERVHGAGDPSLYLPDLGPDGNDNAGRLLDALGEGWRLITEDYECRGLHSLKHRQWDEFPITAATLAHVAALAWLETNR